MRSEYARSSGPGGQNVNKVNSKAELWVTLSAMTGLTPAASARLARLAGRRLTAAGEIHLTAETVAIAGGRIAPPCSTACGK